MDRRRLATAKDSEERYRGEKMRGDTSRGARKDKDINSERIYEMREENKGQRRLGGKEGGRESLWPVVNPCFTDLAVTWLLREAHCQTRASALLSVPSVFI